MQARLLAARPHPAGGLRLRSDLRFQRSRPAKGGIMPDRRMVEDWTTDWDYNCSQYHEGAPDVWRELHQRCPVAHTDRFGGAWLLVGANDIAAVTHDPALFSS